MTPQHIQAPVFQAQQAIRLAREIPDIEAAAVLGRKQHSTSGELVPDAAGQLCGALISHELMFAKVI